MSRDARTGPARDRATRAAATAHQRRAGRRPGRGRDAGQPSARSLGGTPAAAPAAGLPGDGLVVGPVPTARPGRRRAAGAGRPSSPVAAVFPTYLVVGRAAAVVGDGLRRGARRPAGAARAPGGRRVAPARRRPQVRPRLRGRRRRAGPRPAAHRDLPRAAAPPTASARRGAGRGAGADQRRRGRRRAGSSASSPSVSPSSPASAPPSPGGGPSWTTAARWTRPLGAGGRRRPAGRRHRAVPGAPGRRRPRPAGHRPGRPGCRPWSPARGPQALLERPGLALLGGLLLAGAVVLCSVIAPSLRPRLAAVGGLLAITVTVLAAGAHRPAGRRLLRRPRVDACRVPAWCSPASATPCSPSSPGGCAVGGRDRPGLTAPRA